MSFFKTSFWSLVSTMCRLISQFIVAKLISIFVGVSAFGIFGQFQSFVSLVQLGAGGTLKGGLVKYTSQYHDDVEALRNLINTAFVFGLCASLTVGISISIFSYHVSQYIFHSPNYWPLLVAFGMCLFGYTINQMFLSVFNGLNQLKKYVGVSISGSFLTAILVGLLSYLYGVEGSLFGLVLSQIFLFVVCCSFARSSPHLFSCSFKKVDFNVLKKLLSFSSMSVFSAVSFPLACMYLRWYVAKESGWESVGYWQAMIKISDAYIMLLTTMVNMYAVPKFSRLKTKEEIIKEVFMTLLKLTPIVSFLAISVYICRHWIILVLFSKEFIKVESLFLYQLSGDAVKVLSCLIASIFLAKVQIATYIMAELFFVLTYIISSIILYNHFNLVGLSMSFLASYTLYFLAVFALFVFSLRSGKYG